MGLVNENQCGRTLICFVIDTCLPALLSFSTEADPRIFCCLDREMTQREREVFKKSTLL